MKKDHHLDHVFYRNLKKFYPTADRGEGIYIYDMNGVQIKSIPLNYKGNGNIIIQGNELKAGMYFYTLIANNSIVDTKRMILTQ